MIIVVFGAFGVGKSTLLHAFGIEDKEGVYCQEMTIEELREIDNQYFAAHANHILIWTAHESYVATDGVRLKESAKEYIILVNKWRKIRTIFFMNMYPSAFMANIEKVQCKVIE